MRDAVGNINSVLVLGGASEIATETVQLLASRRCQLVVLAVFVLLTGLGLFEVTRRQFAVQWGEIQTEIEKEIKRRETA